MSKPGVMLYLEESRLILRKLSLEESGLLFRAILDYADSGLSPEFEGVLGLAWDIVRCGIDRDSERYDSKVRKSQFAVYSRECKKHNATPLSFEDWCASDDINRCRVVSPDVERYPTPTPTPTPTKKYCPAGAQNDGCSNSIKEVIDLLNTLCGSSFRSTTRDTRNKVNARLKDGYTLEDLKLVVSHQHKLWSGDPVMRKYLRPATLFNGEKFESYLQDAKSCQHRPEAITFAPIEDPWDFERRTQHG